MRDDFTEHEGEPAERGRLRPDDQPGAALPMNALAMQSYASAHAHVGLRAGTLTCGDIGLEPPGGVGPLETLGTAARRLQGTQASYLPVLVDGYPRGALYVEDLFEALADGKGPECKVADVASRLLPTVGVHALLSDAVRLMLASFLRRLPVVGEDERIVGFVTMSEAAAMADRDSTVRDLLGMMALSPSLWARRFR